ncbi:hypothetical protein PM082_007108 [Marasmius tenuissimus]|nr:hypothetical protein PM082_007108 [Marasmius tenuissimus]
MEERALTSIITIAPTEVITVTQILSTQTNTITRTMVPSSVVVTKTVVLPTPTWTHNLDVYKNGGSFLGYRHRNPDLPISTGTVTRTVVHSPAVVTEIVTLPAQTGTVALTTTVIT